MSYTQLKATIEHKSVGIVPHRDFFMDPTARKKFIPELEYLAPKDALLREIEFFDSMKFIEPVWQIQEKVIEKGNNYVITENEIGRKEHTQFNPYFHHIIDYPIKEKSDLKQLKFPDPNDPKRYKSIEEDIEYYSKRDFWIESKEVPGSGFFSGVWYNLRSIDSFLMDMIEDRRFANNMIEIVGEHRLIVAENLLKLGVHSICVNDDMGCTHHAWFSPDMYEEYFYPWHKRMADLCHKYNAYFHIHSHGHIMPFIDKIISTGVDILDPVGPGDKMILKDLKSEYGNRIVIMGGLSKYIASMNEDEMEEHIEEVFKIGASGGGFIAMNEGGIPPDISEERLSFYLKTIKKYSIKYGNISNSVDK